MTSVFVLHPDAYIDLDEIWEYIAADSPNAGDQTIKQILRIRVCANYRVLIGSSEQP
jgi:plasmid stabilization system protein ParE